jgi:hypothetical protein
MTTYERCREYASKSRILLSVPTESAASPKAQSAAVRALSPGLHFECRIITPLDSTTAAAGDPVEGTLRSPIRDKNSGISIPAGARLHGRLTQMEHRSGTFEWFRLSVRWESITSGGHEIPLRAEPDVFNRIGQILVQPGEQEPRSFVIRGDRLRLQQLDWNWTTVAADAGIKSAAGSPPAASSAPLPRTIEISDSEFSVAGGSGVDIKFSVPAGASNVRVEGTFSAAGGDPKEVAVFLFTKNEFLRWQDREPATALYESGHTQQGALNVTLPSDAGTYYLVFSNYTPLSSAKVVQASVRLHYTQ